MIKGVDRDTWIKIRDIAVPLRLTRTNYKLFNAHWISCARLVRVGCFAGNAVVRMVVSRWNFREFEFGVNSAVNVTDEGVEKLCARYV